MVTSLSTDATLHEPLLTQTPPTDSCKQTTTSSDMRTSDLHQDLSAISESSSCDEDTQLDGSSPSFVEDSSEASQESSQDKQEPDVVEEPVVKKRKISAFAKKWIQAGDQAFHCLTAVPHDSYTSDFVQIVDLCVNCIKKFNS